MTALVPRRPPTLLPQQYASLVVVTPHTNPSPTERLTNRRGLGYENTSTSAVTVWPVSAAVIVTCPVTCAVTTPLESTLATAASLLLQLADPLANRIPVAFVNDSTRNAPDRPGTIADPVGQR